MKKYTLAKKDHPHFNNVCCVCLTDCDDSSLVAVWVSRHGGIYSKEYFEPEYACTLCLCKLPEEDLEIDTKI